MPSYSLPTRQLVSQADVARIEPAGVPRSKFLNEWTRKTNFDAGWLIPILVDEVLPGDHMSYDITAYVRMQTPLFPQFDNINVNTFFFFVPCRLVWSNWVRFMGQQDTPGASIAYTVPIINDMTLGGEAVNSIFDHMGLPVLGQVQAAAYRHHVNALPFRAYNLIWNEWFRDENMQSPLTVSTGDGPDTRANYFNKKRGKRPDYFTSALPWPQKFTAPTIALAQGQAPVKGIGVNILTGSAATGSFYETPNPLTGTPAASAFNKYYVTSAAGVVGVNINSTTGYPQIYVDLAAATNITVNALRDAWLIQQLMERDARGGTRYTEIIRAHFGAISPDFRLQRPEYIGGGSSPLLITPIAQTGLSTTNTGLGSVGGAGTAAGTHRASYAATEHGYIIGLINAQAEVSYQQGLHKMWRRQTRYDFYWPALAGLGEQAIKTEEIYATGNPANDDVIFGYQERWHEYRTRTSEVVGIMRSTAAGTLDAWHLAEKFTAAPALNNAFIEHTPPMARVLAGGAAAGSSGLAFLADILYRRQAVRPIPMYGTPSTMGRF